MDVIDMENHRFTLALDALHPNDNKESINVGAEYLIFDMIALRGGYKSLLLDNAEEGLTLGFGLKYVFAPQMIIFMDYAYQEFGQLKNTQHFSVGVNF
jgi:hypothetical protein